MLTRRPADLLAGLAETAFALLIAPNGLAKLFFIEVGPVGVTEVELSIGALPKQVIAQTALATRTDKEVRVRQERGVERFVDGLVVDIFNTESALLNTTGDFLGGLDNLPFTGIGQSNRERTALVISRMLQAPSTICSCGTHRSRWL